MPEREPGYQGKHDRREQVAHGPSGHNIFRIKDIEIDLLENPGQQIVGCNVDRLSKIRKDPAENAVGIQKIDTCQAPSRQKYQKRNRQQAISPKIIGLSVSVAKFLPAGPLPDPAPYVLKDAEGTNRAAVDPAEETGQNQHNNEAGREQAECCKKVYQGWDKLHEGDGGLQFDRH